jgi:hypothetical protein
MEAAAHLVHVGVELLCRLARAVGDAPAGVG